MSDEPFYILSKKTQEGMNPRVVHKHEEKFLSFLWPQRAALRRT